MHFRDRLGKRREFQLVACFLCFGNTYHCSIYLTSCYMSDIETRASAITLLYKIWMEPNTLYDVCFPIQSMGAGDASDAGTHADPLYFVIFGNGLLIGRCRKRLVARVISGSPSVKKPTVRATSKVGQRTKQEVTFTASQTVVDAIVILVRQVTTCDHGTTRFLGRGYTYPSMIGLGLSAPALSDLGFGNLAHPTD